MFRTVLSVLNNFSSVWNTNAAFAAMVALLQNYINQLVADDQWQQTGTKGATAARHQGRQAFVNLVLQQAQGGFAYATATGNAALKVACKITLSTLNRLSDMELVADARNVHDALMPFVSSMAPYGVSANSLANLQTAANAFTAQSAQPSAAKAIVSVATEDADKTTRLASALLKEQLDPMMMQFMLSQPLFYNQYMAARTILDYGHRKTVILKGGVYNGHHKPLLNALVQVDVVNREKAPDASGAYHISGLAAGTYHLTVSAPGYVTQSKTVTAPAPGTFFTDFVMLKAQGSAAA